MPFIYVDVHLKTILASLFSIIFYEGGARGWCARRGSLLQDCFPVKFQDMKLKLLYKEISNLTLNMYLFIEIS